MTVSVISTGGLRPDNEHRTLIPAQWPLRALGFRQATADQFVLIGQVSTVRFEN